MKKPYAIIEVGIDSGRLAYFEDDHPEIWYNSDIYWFNKRDEMSEEEYQEYHFTIYDLTKYYDEVFVCSFRSVLRFVEGEENPIVVDSLSRRGVAVRYGTEDTKIILNPMKEPYKSPYEDDDENNYEEGQ